MQFTRHLHDGIRQGEITCSIRLWKQPRVKVGDGEVQVESILQIAFDDITPELARESGFNGVIDLLNTAKHGSGQNIYLIKFGGVPQQRV